MTITQSNYFSPEAGWEYCGSSQYKDFFGSMGRPGCEAMAMAKLRGEWASEKTPALLIGSYVDSYFEGSLDSFKSENPEIFLKNGTLKSEYKKADDIIDVLKRDEVFMYFMSGEKQRIFTAEIAGVPFKIKIDSLLEEAIVDLKIMASIRKFEWVRDSGKMNFVEYWGYDIQGAIYREAVRQNLGKELPFFIAAASKEKVTDKEVIWVPTPLLEKRIIEVEGNMPRLKELKSGEREPLRCEACDYCRSTRKLTGYLNLYDLQERL